MTETIPPEPDELGDILLAILVVAMAIMLVTSTGCGSAKPVVAEPEPPEAAFTLSCDAKLKTGMTTAEVEEACGQPSSTIYIPTFPDVTALRWCRTPECRQMYAVALFDGHAQFWGRAYEVMK